MAKSASPACPRALNDRLKKNRNFGRKWAFLVIRDLFSGTKRFGELQKSLLGVSPKTLTLCLKEVEEKGVTLRRAYATIPPTVEYSLTEKGESLRLLIKEMKLWGAKWG